MMHGTSLLQITVRTYVQLPLKLLFKAMILSALQQTEQ